MNRSFVSLLVFGALFTVLLSNSPLHAAAYSTTNGLENNDRARFSYKLYVDGKLYQSTSSFETTVSPNSLVLGFYKNILGMKLGEVRSFTVPPSEGYTSTFHELYNKELDFRDVKLLEIIIDASPGDGSPMTYSETENNEQSALGHFIVTYVIPGVATVGVLYLLFILRHRISTFFHKVGQVILPKPLRSKLSYCESCGAPSDGYCAKCGHKYCKQCYLNGCPNCHSNKLIITRTK